MAVSKVVIFGTSGHAKVVASIIETMPEYELIGYISNGAEIGKSILGYRILGSDRCLGDLMEKYSFTRGVIAIGDNFKRSKVANFISKNVPSFRFVNCIHSSANLSKHSNLGSGNVLMPGVTVNPSSIIANHCILNTNSSLDHDCRMDDYSDLAPNSVVGGGSSIGKFSHVGIGASVFHGISIGENSVIGGGSVVNKNVEDHSTYYGVPANFISRRKFGDKIL